MKFCPECGTNIEGMKFCGNCGYKVESTGTIEVPANEPIETAVDDDERELLKFSTYMFGMENQKASIGGKFDLTLPKENYILTDQRLIIEKQGVVTKKREDIELYLIKDINIKQGLKEKMLKVGDIEIISHDKSTPMVTFKRIQNPLQIKEEIRSALRNVKKTMSVSYREEL